MGRYSMIGQLTKAVLLLAIWPGVHAAEHFDPKGKPASESTTAAQAALR